MKNKRKILIFFLYVYTCNSFSQSKLDFNELIKTISNDSVINFGLLSNSKSKIECSDYDFYTDKFAFINGMPNKISVYKYYEATTYINMEIENYSYLFKKHNTIDSINLFTVYSYSKGLKEWKYINFKRHGFLLTKNHMAVLINLDPESTSKNNSLNWKNIKNIYLIDSLYYPNHKLDLYDGELKVITNYLLAPNDNTYYIDFTGVSYFIQKIQFPTLNFITLNSFLNILKDPDEQIKYTYGFMDVREKKYFNKFPLIDLLKD